MTKPKSRGAWNQASLGKRPNHDAKPIVAGRYRLESPIAKGGMGEVWAAYDLTLGRRIALKLVEFREGSLDDTRARFQREIALSRQLRGPAFPEVFAHGTYASQERGERAFLAMELLDGETLQERLKRVGKMSTDEALAFLEGVGAALRVAHSLMIVHRDLKPSNIFFARIRPGSSGTRPRDGRSEIVKLLDFGIAKDAWDDARLTRPGVVMGSAHYMSPEQIRSGADVDVRSDLFSLGTLLYRALTGDRPFEGSAAQALASILHDTPRAATKARSDLPRELDAFFAKALAKDPGRRFQTVDELLEAFRGALGSSRRSEPRSSYIDVDWSDDVVTIAPPPLPSTTGDEARADSSRETVLEGPQRRVAGRKSVDSGLLEELLPIFEPSSPAARRSASLGPLGERPASDPSQVGRAAMVPMAPAFSTASDASARRVPSTPSPWIVARQRLSRATIPVVRRWWVELGVVALVAVVLVVAWHFGLAHRAVAFLR